MNNKFVDAKILGGWINCVVNYIDEVHRALYDSPRSMMQMTIHILLVAESIVKVDTLTTFIARSSIGEYQIITATNVHDAIDLLHNSPPHLVIVTLCLPNPTLFESLLQLKCTAPSIPIVVVSCEQEDTLFTQAIKRLARGYLQEHYLTPQLLTQTVQEVLKAPVSSPVFPDSTILFNALMENTNAAVLICSLDTTIQKSNQSTRKLLGYSEDELIGHRLNEFVAEREHDQMNGNTVQMLARQKLPLFERTYVRKDGVEIIAEVNASLVLGEQGVPLCYLIVAHDVTLRKDLEAKIQADREQLAQRVRERTAELQMLNQELNRTARVKDQFVAAVSHELRTPLSGMLNLTESIQEGVYGPVNERQTMMLDKVRQSGQHLLALLNDILEISRIETQGITLEWDVVFIEELCRNSLFLVQEMARTRNIQLRVSIDVHEKILLADERRFTQVLVNLLGNAIKFTPPFGSVGIEVAEQPATDHSGDLQNGYHQRMIHFTVWDTGIGVATEDMLRLFQPFVQIHNPMGEQVKGTGLGLALVDKLVKLHGGTVAVQSTVGQGSRFTVAIPWRTSPDEIVPSITAQPNQEVWATWTK